MRARERYAVEGAEPFGDAELVALVLGTGAAGRSATGIARELLERFDGLEGLAGTEVVELATVPGIGLARAVRLHAGLSVGRRSLRARPRSRIGGPADAAGLFLDRLRGRPTEELHALYLDRRHGVLGLRRLSVGSPSATVVDPRQVYRPGVALGASAVILAHNHPSGDPEPSAQDREVTRRVVQAGRVLGVPLLDHLVIGGERWVSLAERGVVPRGSFEF